MLEPITKYAAEVHDANTLSENGSNSYRHAKSGKPGASFISIPQDVTDAPVSVKAIKPMTDPKLGSASVSDINYLAQAIKKCSVASLSFGEWCLIRSRNLLYSPDFEACQITSC